MMRSILVAVLANTVLVMTISVLKNLNRNLTIFNNLKQFKQNTKKVISCFHSVL